METIIMIRRREKIKVNEKEEKDIGLDNGLR